MKKIIKNVLIVVLMIVFSVVFIVGAYWLTNVDLREVAAGTSENPVEKLFRQEEFSNQKEISTMEQAVAYFDAKFPYLWMYAAHGDDAVDYRWIESGAYQCNRSADEGMDRAAIVNAITYMLSDDMEIYTVIGFRCLR